MKLSARPLENVENVNNWIYASEAYVMEDQANTLYFQIVDLSKNPQLKRISGAFPEFPMRYLSQASSVSVSISFPAIDDDEEFTVVGNQPYSDDVSIWSFPLSSSQLPKSGYAKFQIVEDGITRTFLVNSVIRTELLSVGGC